MTLATKAIAKESGSNDSGSQKAATGVPAKRDSTLVTTTSRAHQATRQANKPVSPVRFAAVYLKAPQEHIGLIKLGITAEHVGALAGRMNLAKETLIESLRLSRATVNRKMRESKYLSQDESERVLGVEYLIGQVENMVGESGNPAGFDAAKWVSNWLKSPLPALSGKTPADYLDTVEGQKLV